MKLKSLFTSALAILALAVGCSKQEFPSLKEISVTPSYFTMETEAGQKELSVISSTDWEIKDIPEWITVTPEKGTASTEIVTVTLSVEANKAEESRTAYLKFTSANESQLVTVIQKALTPEFPHFEAGNYWIICGDQALKPIEGKGYGYLESDKAVETDGKLISTAANIFTFTAVEGGFNLQDANGKYYYMTGTYNSFNIADAAPETGAVWTVAQVSATEFNIINASNGKLLQYDAGYGSAGAYPDGGRVLPTLVKVEEIPEPEPEPELGDAISIGDITKPAIPVTVEGIVTAVCSSGVVITDETASILAYQISDEVKLGDEIKVKGNLTAFNHGYQLGKDFIYEIKSSENEVVYPEATELTAEGIPALIAPSTFLAKYVSVSGKVSTDKYNNALISVGDYTVKTYYSNDSYADLANKNAEIKGYLVSFKDSSKELNVVVTSITEIEGGEDAVLESIAWTGYTTNYTVNETFKKDGTVTATYSDGATADVTADATFSSPDMTTAGEKTVTVTYEGKETTGTITVNEAGGDTETEITFDLGYTATDVKTADWELTQDGVSLNWSKGSGSNIPSPNKEGTVRMYTNTTLTITAPAGKNITKVVFTPISAEYDATKLSYDGTNLTSDSWTLSSPVNSVVLKATANARFKKIVVTYK